MGNKLKDESNNIVVIKFTTKFNVLESLQSTRRLWSYTFNLDDTPFWLSSRTAVDTMGTKFLFLYDFYRPLGGHTCTVDHIYTLPATGSCAKISVCVQTLADSGR